MAVFTIISAALTAYGQNFRASCRNRGMVLDKVDEMAFGELATVLMDAARAAGVAGLETFLVSIFADG